MVSDNIEVVRLKKFAIEQEMMQVNARISELCYVPMMCGQAEGILWKKENEELVLLEKRTTTLERLNQLYTKQLRRLIRRERSLIPSLH
jgi:hypothetical protein